MFDFRRGVLKSDDVTYAVNLATSPCLQYLAIGAVVLVDGKMVRTSCCTCVAGLRPTTLDFSVPEQK